MVIAGRAQRLQALDLALNIVGLQVEVHPFLGYLLRAWWPDPPRQLHPPVWIPTTRAAGVEGSRFHDLRHTAATLAVAAGASTRELMVRMGHSSSAAALRYQHVMAGRDAAIAATLDELVQAASTRSQDPAAAGRGTRLARTGRSGRKGQRR